MALAYAGIASAQERLRDDTVARVELRPLVEVGHSDVSLGEVANISSKSLPALQRLMALPLGQVPRNGDIVELRRDMLARWIRLRLGLTPEQIAWSGDSASTVRLATRVLSGERIANAAKQQLQAALKEGDLRAEISLQQVPRDVVVPGGQIAIVPRATVVAQGSAFLAGARRGDAPPPKRQTVWVDLWADGRFVRSVPVGFDMSFFAAAYVAKRDLMAGQTLELHGRDAADLSVREIDWSATTARPIPVSPALSGMGPEPETVAVSGPSLRLRRQIAAGQALTQADVEVAPTVTRGEFATLHTHQGAIELDTRVEVLQDGALGHSVRVKLPNASTSIVARVTGAGQVEVRE